MTSEMNRRSFLKGGATLGALGLLGGMVGCSPQQSATRDLAETGDSPEESWNITETMDVDIVVVGAGNAGMPAAAQAAELGASVLVLEKEDNIGGNGMVTFGPFGVNTKYSKACGIDFDYHEALAEELHRYNCHQNIRFFMDMAEASSDNIDWIVDHGAAISPTVDNYKGGHPTMHYFSDGVADVAKTRVGMAGCYIEAMRASAEASGAQIMTSTPAVDILMDDSGAVSGVIAQKKDGDCIQVNAKAVIFATGGWQANPELCTQQGRPEGPVYMYCGMPGPTGDGWRLSLKAGAQDTSWQAGYIDQPLPCELFGPEAPWTQETNPMFNDDHSIWKIVKFGNGIFVNERGERFVDEACGHPETGLATWTTSAIMAHERCYVVVDQAIADTFVGADVMQACMGVNSFNTKFQADTLADLAQQMDMEPAVLEETVERYNGFCQSGADGDFGKREDALVPLGEGPYYAMQLGVVTMASIGGVRINRDMQALDPNWQPIAGLYVVGVDSLPFYPSMYYFNMPGTAIAFEIHSGLVAARHAAAALGL